MVSFKNMRHFKWEAGALYTASFKDDERPLSPPGMPWGPLGPLSGATAEPKTFTWFTSLTFCEDPWAPWADHR